MQAKFLLLLTLFLLFAGAVAYNRQQPDSNFSTSPSAATRTPEAAPLEVSVVTAVERPIARTIEITGTLEGQEEVTVSSEVEGRIAEMYVDFGSYVKAGDKLLELDKRELEWRVSQAEAAVASAEAHLGPVGGPPLPVEENPEIRNARAAMEQAKVDYERTQKLLEKGDIPRQEYDRAKTGYDQARARLDATFAQIDIYRANLDQARAQLSLARKQLADAAVRAPITGAIKERLTSKGEYLTKGHNVVRIVQIDPLRLRGDVPEQYVNKLRTSQPVSFYVDSMPDTKFNGAITRLSPSVDKNSRALTIEATVKNGDLKLKPGLFAHMFVGLASQGTAVMVPQRALVTTAGLTKLYLLADGRAQSRQVKLGQRDGDMVEILEGIKPSDQIITDKLDKLEEGNPVRKL